MTFSDFFSKNKKIIIVVAIIIFAVIIGVLTTKTFGGIAGVASLLWGVITGRKSERQKAHQAELEKIDTQIEDIHNEEIVIEQTITDSKADITQIKQERSEIEERVSKMSLQDKIDMMNRLMEEEHL